MCDLESRLGKVIGPWVWNEAQLPLKDWPHNSAK